MSPLHASLVLATLPALALSALEIQDKETSLSIGCYLQAVAAKGTATVAGGDAYNATEGIAGRGDDLDLYLRRFRPSFKGTFQGVQFVAILAADNAGRATAAGASAPTVTLYEGYVGRSWVLGATRQTVTFGKQLPWFNPAATRSSTQQFVGSRASAEYLAPCGVGAGYRLVAPMISLGLDVQNNTGDDATNQAGTNHGEGLTSTARLEITGPDADHLAIGTWQESFAGAAGHGLALGLEAGVSQRDRTSPTTGQTVTVYGGDLLLHWDALSALVEAAHQTTTVMPDAAADDVTGAGVVLVQAGWAMPWDGVGVVEPALRWQAIDGNTAQDAEGLPFGGKDYGASGREVDAQVTLYQAGHRLKTGLMVTRWRGEESAAGTPRATIVRLQQQILF